MGSTLPFFQRLIQQIADRVRAFLIKSDVAELALSIPDVRQPTQGRPGSTLFFVKNANKLHILRTVLASQLYQQTAHQVARTMTVSDNTDRMVFAQQHARRDPVHNARLLNDLLHDLFHFIVVHAETIRLSSRLYRNA